MGSDVQLQQRANEKFGLGLLLFCFLCAAAAGRVAQSDPGTDVQCISESDEEVIFELRAPRPELIPVIVEGRDYLEVRLPDCTYPAASGAPDLPVKELLVALPPGTEPVVTVLESETEILVAGRVLPKAKQTYILPSGNELGIEDRLPAFQIEYVEGSAYEGHRTVPAQLAGSEFVRHWRHLRVALILVRPVRYDPQSEQVIWHPRIRVRVTFVRSEGGGSGPAEVPYPVSEPRWEKLFHERILNYPRARAYKTSPRAALRTPLWTEPDPVFEIRLAVDATGIYEVDFEDLETTGAFTGDLAWEDLKLVVRDYNDAEDEISETEVALMAMDDDGDGLFEPGEALIFYGQDAWDCFGLTGGEKRYGRRNVYWLVGGEGAGARMDSASAWYEGEVLPPRTTFERTIHFEDNLYYMEFVADGDGTFNRRDPFSFGTDHYNWTPRDAWINGIHWRPFKAVALDLPNMWKPVELCVHLQGQKKVDGSGRHRPRLWLSSTPEVEPGSVSETDTLWAFPGNPYAIYGSHDTLICIGEEGLTNPNKLNTGRNYLKIYLPTEGDGIDNVNGNYIGIDWAEVTYLGYFWLDSDGRLDANLEEFTGVQELSIRTMTGNEAPEILGLDITDPLSPVVFKPEDFQFDRPGSSHWRLTLRVQYDGAAFPRKLLFIERSGLDRLDQSAISRRPGEALTGFSGEDYLAIYPHRFAGNLEPLLSHRETQGHNVLWAPVEDVFDTYSGGRRHPYAIKRLLRRMWRRSTPVPEYLLLAGDASNDIAGHTLGNEGDRSDSNYVPVMTVPGFGYGSNTEVISCDHWYVNRLLDDWTDPMTGDVDMHLGRVPCGTEEEFDTYVSKVLAYEQDDLTAPWRNRVILHSDGTFSGDPANYRHRYTEHHFRWITERSGNWILQDSTFAHFQVEFLYQHAVMDSVVDLGRCKKDPEDSTRCLRDYQGNVVLDSSKVIPFVPSQEYGEDKVNPMLETALSKGALIWAFQGHSHRKQVAHERVFVLESSNSNLADVEDLSNIDKPFVFVGCGCHITDYAHHEEYGRRGDALAEVVMFCCPREPRAAIASIGSVTYEAIGHDFEEKLFEAMFHDPQKDELGRTRWRLGELVTQTKCKPLNFSTQRLTYMLLGDPALRIGIAPPAIRLSLNGAEWDCGASEVVEYISDREDDSLAVVIYLSDESHVTLPQVFDHDGAVPEDLLHIVEEQASDDRRMAIEYCTQVQRRSYDILIRAVDYDGSEREARVRIPMSIAFYEVAGEEMISLSEGSILQRDSRPAVTIRTGVHLAQGDFELLVNGEPLELEATEVDQEESGAFLWTLHFSNLSGQADGPITFEVMVTQWDQSVETLATLQAEIGEVGLRFNSCQWIPSPFAESSTLVYELSRHAGGVGVCIYTVSGRRIFKASGLPQAKGQRHFVWDGRDDDGDAVANGLYFYQLTARDSQGKVAHELLEKLVRTR